MGTETRGHGGLSDVLIPLFPLHTVLFPGGLLPLRIFEPRYLDMVSECLRSSSGFGVCLIREGREVGEAAQVHGVGTLASIVDWQQLPDGLLGITVQGERRYRVLDSRIRENGLRMAEVELLEEEREQALPEDYQSLASLLGRILGELGEPYGSMPRALDRADWVGARLTELLPLGLEVKQRLLELDDPIERLATLRAGMLDLDVN